MAGLAILLIIMLYGKYILIAGIITAILYGIAISNK